ncbi:MAG: hypothetical protein ABI068_14840 [Ktedonobacterales bacterium]
MSGPGGATTKRDQRRDARLQQHQQRQLERQRERTRQIRTKRIRQGSLIGGAALLIVLLAVLVSVFVFHIGGSSTHPPTHPSTPHGWLAPLDGQVSQAVDVGVAAQENTTQRIMVALDIPADRQPGTGPQVIQRSQAIHRSTE